MTNKKIDLFELLARIDSCDVDYFDSKSDEDKKKVFFFLIQRWMTGTTDEKQIIQLNHFVNSKLFRFYRHPDLVYRLLCLSSTGKKRYSWMARPKKKKSYTAVVDLIMAAYDCNSSEAKDYSTILSKDAIIQLAKDFGVDKDVLKSILKELK